MITTNPTPSIKGSNAVSELVVKYEFVDHGLKHPDYFQGCGVAFSSMDFVFTGIGNTPEEAAHEALELASLDLKWNDAVFEDAEKEATHAFLYSFEPIEEGSDAMFHVSIRVGVIT